MAPEDTAIVVTRVLNGWTLAPWNWRREGEMIQQQLVARTPKELADIIQEWASKQTDPKG